MTSAKVQEELDATVGRTRAPSLADRAHLPYTNAVLHEIQRFISVLPLGLPRALIRDVNLRNHFLHKVHREPGNSALGGRGRANTISTLGAPLPGSNYHLRGWGAAM